MSTNESTRFLFSRLASIFPIYLIVLQKSGFFLFCFVLFFCFVVFFFRCWHVHVFYNDSAERLLVLICISGILITLHKSFLDYISVIKVCSTKWFFFFFFFFSCFTQKSNSYAYCLFKISCFFYLKLLFCASQHIFARQQDNRHVST